MTWSAVHHCLAVILRKPSKQLNYFLFTNLSYVVCIILHILIAFYHYIHLKRRKIYSPDFSCCVYRAPCLGHRFFNAACHAQAFSSSYISRTVKGTVTRDGEGGSIYFSPNCSKRKNHMISTLKEQFLPHISRSHWKGPEDFFARGKKDPT